MATKAEVFVVTEAHTFAVHAMAFQNLQAITMMAGCTGG
jgi:hypothetical protein